MLNWKLKIVNENNFYLQLKQLLHIEYPDIKGSKLLSKVKHVDNDGDTFYTYEWQVFLTDESSVFYKNQENKMDMIKGDFSYQSIIQERTFINFLNNKYDKN